MKSLDTNVVLRALIVDDDEQAATALAAMSGPAYLTPTVLLETAWVLGSVAKLARDQIASNLSDILAMPNVVIAQRDNVRWAVDRYAAGADFADMLHLALSGGSDCFATFDQGVARFSDASQIPVETLRP
ncbi:type II toxin-antitoxin system VapC family toxin [Sphingomonas sp. SUN039]|uniref:type II toxin-antitoxin system VapC family toxin n=1 Tax=Sphingomonas sp. SUN039 TaxID=2937787 RepID=UPI0021648D3D|nr:type II toxin-antitoxin system VapC family toxin [Sphingomonas sp. SUN039]